MKNNTPDTFLEKKMVEVILKELEERFETYFTVSEMRALKAFVAVKLEENGDLREKKVLSNVLDYLHGIKFAPHEHERQKLLVEICDHFLKELQALSPQDL